MPAGRKIGIIRRIKNGYAAPLAVRDRARLIEPLGVCEMRPGLVQFSLGSSNFAGSVEHGHRLRHTRGEESERSFAESNRVGTGGCQRDLNIDAAKILRG